MISFFFESSLNNIDGNMTIMCFYTVCRTCFEYRVPIAIYPFVFCGQLTKYVSEKLKRHKANITLLQILDLPLVPLYMKNTFLPIILIAWVNKIYGGMPFNFKNSLVESDPRRLLVFVYFHQYQAKKSS